MPHQLIKSKTVPYIEILHEGKITRDVVKTCKEEILHLAKTEEPIYILCNLYQADFKASISDMYYVPQTLADMKLKRSSRIAIILPENHKSWREVKFLETVSINRGWYLSLFTNKEDAEKWLIR